jgi:hypothetical protein
MRATAPGLCSWRFDRRVLEVPGQEGSHAVRVANVHRDQPSSLRRVGTVPGRPSPVMARDADQPVPRGIQTPAHSAPEAARGRHVVIETHPRLRITGPAGFRDDQRRRQALDEIVAIGHDRTFERTRRTPSRLGLPRREVVPVAPGPRRAEPLLLHVGASAASGAEPCCCSSSNSGVSPAPRAAPVFRAERGGHPYPLGAPRGGELRCRRGSGPAGYLAANTSAGRISGGTARSSSALAIRAAAISPLM